MLYGQSIVRSIDQTFDGLHRFSTESGTIPIRHTSNGTFGFRTCGGADGSALNAVCAVTGKIYGISGGICTVLVLCRVLPNGLLFKP